MKYRKWLEQVVIEARNALRDAQESAAYFDSIGKCADDETIYAVYIKESELHAYTSALEVYNQTAHRRSKKKST